MVLAALAAGAIAAPVVGGLLGFANSEAARRASAAELSKIEDLLNKIQTPNFSWADISPEEYSVVQKYVPKVADYIKEKDPTIVQRTEVGKEGLDAQLSALRRLKQVGESGVDAQSQLLQEQALKNAQIQNQGQQAQILNNFANRGMGGSGLELAAALSAQQSAGQQGALASQNAALDAYTQRLQALKDSAALGGNIENADTALQAKNAGIINDFNQRAAASRQAYENNSSNILNEAQLKNIGMAQDVANRNVAGRNSAQQLNQQMRNQLQQQNYDNQMAKANTLRGVSSDKSRNIMSAAQDQNQAIQGLTGGISSGLLYAYGNANQPQSTNNATSSDFDYSEYLKQKMGRTA